MAKVNVKYETKIIDIDEVDIDGKAMGKKDKSGGHNIYTK